MMERNYKLMVSVLDCFDTNYKEFDKVVFLTLLMDILFIM